MKKVLLLFALLLGTVGYTSAQEELLYRCQFGDGYNSAKTSSYTGSFTVTDAQNSSFTWNVENANNNNNSWNYIKIGDKNAARIGKVTSVDAIPEVITRFKVSISAITAAKVNSIKFQASKNADFSELYYDETLIAATGEQEIVFEIEDTEISDITDLHYQLVVDCQKGTSNGIVSLDWIELYGYDPNDSREVVNLSWNMEDLVVMEGDEFEQPVLTAYNGETIELDALDEVVYTTSNATVATVVNGAINIKGTGIAVVTATIPESSKNFRPTSAAINVVVVNHFADGTVTGNLTAGESCFNAPNSYTGVKYISDLTGIIYQGNMAKGTGNDKDAIQIKDEAPVGIVVTANKLGLALRKVSIEWSTTLPSNNRTLKVYASETPYATSNDLYDSEKCGVEIGEIDGTTTVLNLDPIAHYSYVGFKAVGGVIYIKNIELEWEKPYTAKGAITINKVQHPENDYFVNNLGLTVTIYDELGQPIEDQDNYIVYMNGEELDFAGELIEYLPYAVDATFTVKDDDSEFPVEIIGWASIAGATTTIDNLKYNIIVDPTDESKGSLWATFELGANHNLADEVIADFVFKSEDGKYDFKTEHMEGQANIYWQDNKAWCQLQGVKLVDLDGGKLKDEADLAFDNITITPVFGFLVEAPAQQNGRMRAPSAGNYSICEVEGTPTSLNHNNVASAEGITYEGVSGVADVVVDGEAVVEFYNLQGVKVEGELAPGLYIRRQGNEATKVLVK